MTLFDGVCVAMITPFCGDDLDFDCLDRLVNKYLNAGIDAICVCGTTGEPNTITTEERVSLYSFVRERASGKIPFIAGVGCNGTSGTIKSALIAEESGADGLLVVTPYYNRCTQRGLVLHYREVCASTRLPVIAYNVPSRTGVNMLPETAADIAAIPNLVGIKEASGNAVQFQETVRLCGKNAVVYSGEDSLDYAGLCLGSGGIISVAAGVYPEAFVALHKAYREGRSVDARNFQFALTRLINALFCEVNPIPVKRALAMLGYGNGVPRLPLTPLSERFVPELQEALNELGLFEKDE